MNDGDSSLGKLIRRLICSIKVIVKQQSGKAKNRIQVHKSKGRIMELEDTNNLLQLNTNLHSEGL